MARGFTPYYVYDAWGRWVYYIQDADWSSVLGGINPLLYRGYVYDHETGLYYLQSRYYDMNTHRFLNADVFTATGQGLLGNNMFAYCNNNPVNMLDIAGEMPLPVATELFEKWVEGTGKKQEYDNKSSVFNQLRSSNTMQLIIEEEIGKYERNEPYGSGTVKFGSDELDLWLGVRRASYILTIEEEQRKKRGLEIEIVTRYVVQVKVFDTYNFNTGNEKGDGIGSILNNIGYWMQDRSIGKEYSWEANYVYTTTWK